MDSKIAEIKKLLCEKSQTKQDVYQVTRTAFAQLKKVMQDVTSELTTNVKVDAPKVELKYFDKTDFEMHLKFGGDTLVAMMHTNIFDFDENHFLSKSKYVKDDPMREFCGMIQIYNFLSDSIKYNREQDLGYLIARIFINKEGNFFVEGKRPLSFLYTDIEKNVMSDENLRNIIEESMLFCLHFDLMAPPIESISYISLEQKNVMSYGSGMPTAKHLGFTMSRDEADFSA